MAISHTQNTQFKADCKLKKKTIWKTVIVQSFLAWLMLRKLLSDKRFTVWLRPFAVLR